MGALSSAQQIMIRLYLLGGPKYREELLKAGVITKEFAASQTRLGEAMVKTNKRTFLQNQLLFTARRAMFYTTLGAIGLTAEVVRMGFAYDSAMQSTNVALQQVIKPQALLNREMAQLFQIAAKTPFQVKDITTAFRQMYISFKPFDLTTNQINDTILAITNNLSATGKVTPASLMRVSTALSHMGNVGHLTGQAVLQLARDGLQLQPALQKELGITGDQLHNLGTLGISAKDVLAALVKYSQTTPGIMNAAFRQANLTLAGSASSLRDYISQASGSALGGPGGQKGIFGGIQKNIVGINKELDKMTRHGHVLTIMDIAKAMDQQLTPKTHALMNAFITFSTALHVTIFTLGLLFKAVTTVLTPFDKLLGVWGSGHKMAKVVGIALGVLGGILTVSAGLWFVYRGAVESALLAHRMLRPAIVATSKVLGAQDILLGAEGGAGLLGKTKKMGTFSKWKKWATEEKVVGRVPAWKARVPVLGPTFEKEFVNQGRLARLSRSLFDNKGITLFTGKLKTLGTTFKTGGLKAGFRMMFSGLLSLIPILITAAGAAWGFTVALLANPITWIVIGIVALILALVLLYRKWQWFHDLVNRSARFVKKYWEYFLIGIPVIGWTIFALAEMVKHWHDFAHVLGIVVGWLKRMYDWVKKLRVVKWLGGIIHAVTHAVGTAASATGGAVGKGYKWTVSSDVHATPKQAGGPIFGSGGLQLVGERGPELVSLPGGSHVFPNSQLNRVQPVGFRGGGGEHEKPIIVQVMLDRKVLAQGVARANQDYAARR
jgi:hypothetical protein